MNTILRGTKKGVFVPNTCRIEGGVAIIELTDSNGTPIAETLIDASDAPSVVAYGRWHRTFVASRTRNITSRYPYALCQAGRSRHTTILHRFIMNAPKGIEVDHINHDTLDNRRENLRLVTKSQNQQNTFGHCDSKSGIRNVYWQEGTQKWLVQVSVNYKRVHGGQFKDLSEAAAAAESLRRKLHTHCPENSPKAVADALRLVSPMLPTTLTTTVKDLNKYATLPNEPKPGDFNKFDRADFDARRMANFS